MPTIQEIGNSYGKLTVVEGGQLVAHHIEAFNSNLEKRLDTDNGICLCKDCHNIFHNRFGRGDNTVSQLNIFLYGETA